MDAGLIIFLALACLVIGATLGWLAATARTQRAAATARADAAARIAAAEAERAGLREQLERQRDLHRDLAERAHREQAERDSRERERQSVLRALAPVQESLQTMQRRVESIERERAEQFGTLAEQLRRAQESDEALRQTTESLAGALRSGPARGVWGETQLRRVVEAAGLTRYVDFDVQASVTSDAGAGRPDLVVRLPGDKALAVDAKVPLDAYLEAAAIPLTATGDDATRRRTLLARHVKAVRAHIDALAKKQYWAGLPASPELVVCFVPSEALLAAALDEDPALLDYAFSRRVALASPVTLWALLKTVAYTWTQQDVSAQARELFRLGSELYQRIGALARHTDELRRALERSVEAYNRFAGSLESRVLVTARKFPGIDETRLPATDAPAPLEATPRPLAAPELLADLGEVRERVREG